MKQNAENIIPVAQPELPPNQGGAVDAQIVAQASVPNPAGAPKVIKSSSKSYVLSDGQNMRPVNNGDMWVQARGGRKFRLLRADEDAATAEKARATGDVAVEKVTAMDSVVALRDGQNLVLLADQEHAVTLEDFFTQCIGDRCTVMVPSAEGEVPLVIEGKMWQEGWNGVVYAYGDKGTLTALSTGYGNAYPGLQQGLGDHLAAREVTVTANKAGMLSPLMLLGGGVGVLAAAGGGGGGGGGGGWGDTPVLSSVVTGTFTGGPALSSNGLSVHAYSATGASLGTVTLGANGAYSLTLSGYTGVVIIKLLKDGDVLADYMDESTKAGKDLDSSIFAVGNVVAGQNTVINITPLTDIAARKMGLNETGNTVTSTATQVDALNHLVSKLFLNLDADVTKLDPQPVINDQGVSVTGDTYGKVLAYLSGTENALGLTTVGMTQLLANHIDVNSTTNTGSLSPSALETLALGISQAIQGGALTLAEGTQLADDLRGGLTATVPSLIIYGEAGTLNLTDGARTVYFLLSAASTNFDVSDITVSNGTLANFAQDSSNPRLYSVDVTADTNYVGPVAVAVAAGKFSNAQAVNNTAGFTLTLVADTIPPTQTVSAVSLSSDTGTSSTDHITRTAAQTITGTLSQALGTTDILYGSVDGGSHWVNITGMVSGTSVNWTGVTLAAGSGNIAFKVGDKAGNAPSVSPTVAYTLDTTAPTQTVNQVSLLTDAGASATDMITNVASQTVRGVLSTALGTNDMLYGSLDNGATWTDITNKVAGTAITWDGVTLTTGTHAIRFKVADKAGNAEFVSPATNYTLDTTVATPTLTLAADTGVAGDSITSNMTVNVGGLEAGATWEYQTTSGWTPGSGTSFQLTPGQYSVGAIQVRQTDVAGNVATGSNTAAWTVDTSAPTLTITHPNVASGGTAAGPVQFVFTFSEAVVGFNLSDIAVSGGTAGALTTSDGITYNLTVTPPSDSQANLSVSVVAGVATDVAGNASAAANGGNPVVVAYNTIAPSVTITSDKSAGATKDPITFLFTFSEEMTGFDAGDISVTGGTAGAFVALPDSKSYTLQVTPAAGVTGEVTVSVAQGVALGVSTKPNLASTVFHQPIDTQAPAAPLSITEYSSGTPKLVDSLMNQVEVNAGPTWFRVQLSTAADNTGPKQGDQVSLYLGATVVQTLSLTATDIANHYVGFQLAKTDWGADGSKTLTAMITDQAGNISSSSPLYTFELDTVGPAALPLPTLANDTGMSNSDGITSDGTVLVSVPNGQAWQYSTDGGGNWNIGVGNSFVVSGPDGNKTVDIRAVDLAGNPGASTTFSFELNTVVPTPGNVVGGDHLAGPNGTALTNLDVTSNIVLDFGNDIVVQSGKLITLNNTGGTGFQGEAFDSGIQLYLSNGKTYSDAGMTVENGTYTVSGHKLSLNPNADLDLANNYEVIVSAGVVKGAGSGEDNAAMTLKFSTVTPTSATTGAEGVFMDDANGSLSRYWVTLPSAGGTFDASGHRFVYVIKDVHPDNGDWAVNMASDQTVTTFNNFSSNDVLNNDFLYIDSQGKTSLRIIQAGQDFTPGSALDGDGSVYVSANGPGSTAFKMSFGGYYNTDAPDMLTNGHAVIG